MFPEWWSESVREAELLKITGWLSEILHNIEVPMDHKRSIMPAAYIGTDSSKHTFSSFGTKCVKYNWDNPINKWRNTQAWGDYSLIVHCIQ